MFRQHNAVRPHLAPQLLLLAVILMSAAGDLLAGAVAQVQALSKAALLVQDGGRDSIAHNPDKGLVPASTMKVLTALHALDRWGRSYRFTTEFLLDDERRLWTRGLGDPYLVSEELDQAVRAIKAAGIDKISGVGVDASLFEPNARIPGRSSTNNPYDAPVTALAVNFNTINVRVRGGRILAAEPQTQLTPLARKLASGLGSGRHRINLKNQANSLRYSGELIAAKLKAAGVSVGSSTPRIGRVPAGASLVHTHQSSRTLDRIIASMLEYSTNFVANDLFLLLGDQGRNQRTMAKAQRAGTDWARKRFGWKSVAIEDGAGLSRGNRLSARQLIDVLEAFKPYRDLMPKQDGNSSVRAKTGTLRGVSCYAGYVKRRGGWSPFALLINQPVAYNLRLRVASELARQELTDGR